MRFCLIPFPSNKTKQRTKAILKLTLFYNKIIQLCWFCNFQTSSESFQWEASKFPQSVHIDWWDGRLLVFWKPVVIIVSFHFSVIIIVKYLKSGLPNPRRFGRWVSFFLLIRLATGSLLNPGSVSEFQQVLHPEQLSEAFAFVPLEAAAVDPAILSVYLKASPWQLSLSSFNSAVNWWWRLSGKSLVIKKYWG